MPVDPGAGARRPRHAFAQARHVMPTTVSVVIPCYNAAAYLREAVESALGQTHPPLEVVVVDDGSTDDSAAIAESYGAPVRVLREPTSKQGPGVARNRGIEESRGDWVAFLDADDLWEAAKLEKQLAAGLHADVVMVHTNWRGFGSRSFVRDFTQIPEEGRYSIENFLAGRLPLNMSNIMVRRSLDVRFPNWVYYAADTVYNLDVSRKGRIVLVPEVLSSTRFHAGSMSAAAGVYAEQVQVLGTWLSRHAAELDSGRVARLRRLLLDRLVPMAWAAFWQRRWKAFSQQREYLRPYASEPDVAELLRLRVYSPWLYRVKDFFDRLRRR